MKVYDRVYLKTDKFIYTYNIEDMAGSTEIGNVYDRLVPVVDNYTPDNDVGARRCRGGHDHKRNGKGKNTGTL